MRQIVLLAAVALASTGAVQSASAQSGRPLNTGGVAEYPRFSPDGRKIAFVTNRDGNWEIYVMDVEGGNPTRLTTNVYDDAFPSWSPDGSQIAYASKATGFGYALPSMSAIFVMNADGSEARRVTNTEVGGDAPVQYYNDSSPVWEPDGERIAFLSDRANRYREIFLINPDGTGLIQVTFRDAHHWNLGWTPDSRRIVFDGREDRFPYAANNPKWGMYSIRVSGGRYSWGDDLRVLRNETTSSMEYDSAISPDGRTIVFLLAQRDPELKKSLQGLALAQLDTTDGGLRVIEDTITILPGGSRHSVTWSPDGTRMAFVSARDGHAEIYVMNADGSDPRRLTFSR